MLKKLLTILPNKATEPKREYYCISLTPASKRMEGDYPPGTEYVFKSGSNENQTTFCSSLQAFRAKLMSAKIIKNCSRDPQKPTREYLCGYLAIKSGHLVPISENATKVVLKASTSKSPREPKKEYLCMFTEIRAGRLKIQPNTDEPLTKDNFQKSEPFYLTLPTSVTEQMYFEQFNMKSLFTKAWHFITKRKSHIADNR